MEDREFATKLGAIRKAIENALEIDIKYPGQERYLKQAKLRIEMALVNLGFPVTEECPAMHVHDASTKGKEITDAYS